MTKCHLRVPLLLQERVYLHHLHRDLVMRNIIDYMEDQKNIIGIGSGWKEIVVIIGIIHNQIDHSLLGLQAIYKMAHQVVHIAVLHLLQDMIMRSTTITEAIADEGNFR